MVVSSIRLTLATMRSADDTFSWRFALPMTKLMPVAASSEVFPFMSLNSSGRWSLLFSLERATCDLCASNTKLSSQPLVFCSISNPFTIDNIVRSLMVMIFTRDVTNSTAMRR